MIGGSQSILLIGGIICICYISISIGAGLYYYNQGGSLKELKNKKIKKKKARSAAALICTEGNVIYNGKCLKQFTNQECRDENDVFWKADAIKKGTECIEIEDDNLIIDYTKLQNIVYKSNIEVEKIECCVCYENATIKTNCRHYGCEKCFQKLNNKCPYCRQDITEYYKIL